MWCPICKEDGLLNELDLFSISKEENILKCDECKTHFDKELNIIKKGEK